MARKHCPECGVLPGRVHLDGCDVERCVKCGVQRFSCRCLSRIREPWSGEWPGLSDCRKHNLWCRLVTAKGWVSCKKSDLGAVEDFNALVRKFRYDHKTKKWVKK
jgi:hypothetical protein